MNRIHLTTTSFLGAIVGILILRYGSFGTDQASYIGWILVISLILLSIHFHKTAHKLLEGKIQWNLEAEFMPSQKLSSLLFLTVVLSTLVLTLNVVSNFPEEPTTAKSADLELNGPNNTLILWKCEGSEVMKAGMLDWECKRQQNSTSKEPVKLKIVWYDLKEKENYTKKEIISTEDEFKILNPYKEGTYTLDSYTNNSNYSSKANILENKGINVIRIISERRLREIRNNQISSFSTIAVILALLFTGLSMLANINEPRNCIYEEITVFWLQTLVPLFVVAIFLIWTLKIFI